MSNLFRFGLYTTQDLAKPETARVVWRQLAEPLFNAQYFDSVEDARFPFSTKSSTAAELYEDEGVLFVTAKKSNVLAAFNRQTARLSTWDFYIPLKEMKNSNAGLWQKWIFDLCSRLPVVFGFGCSIEEYHAKHRQIKNLPGGGRVTVWPGVSITELKQYLPGIYWLNVFGSDLVDVFGKGKLDSLPDVKSYSLDHNQTAIVLDEPIVPEEMEKRLLREQRIAEQLDERYFFDRAKPDIEYRSIEQIKGLVE